MLVDGYNVIYSWGIDTDDMHAAREKLLDVLDDYAGFSGEDITVVFDGYNKRQPALVEKRGLLTVVFTAFGVTADIHIQRIVKESGGNHKVVTADCLEQLSVFASGAVRITPAELKTLIAAAREKHISLIDRSSLSKSELKKRLALDSIGQPE